jgi:hypothetical protein
MPYQSGAFILGPSHTIRIQPDINPIGLPSPVILDGPQVKFSSEEKDSVVENDTIDDGGQISSQRVPGNITGMIEMDKAGQDFSQLMMALDSYYFNGRPNGEITFTMTETITLADGTLETNQFIKTVFHGYKRGDYTRAGRVQSSVNFNAKRVVPV